LRAANKRTFFIALEEFITPPHPWWAAHQLWWANWWAKTWADGLSQNFCRILQLLVVGQRFLIPQPGGGPAIAGGALADQLATFADQGGTSGAGNPITVVLNWPRMLKRK
jgi:hypothetical protein